MGIFPLPKVSIIIQKAMIQPCVVFFSFEQTFYAENIQINDLKTTVTSLILSAWEIKFACRFSWT